MKNLPATGGRQGNTTSFLRGIVSLVLLTAGHQYRIDMEFIGEKLGNYKPFDTD